MKTALLLFMLGCGGVDYVHISPVDSKPATFDLGVLEQPGAKTRRTTRYHVDLDLTAEAGSHSVDKHITGDGRGERTDEVVEVKDGAVTKMKVSYGEDSFTAEGENPRVDPTVGKTFVVELVGADMHVLLEDGSQPTEKMSKRVRGDFSWMGKKVAAQTKTFRPGEQVAADVMPLLEREASKLGIDVSKSSAVYRGQHEDEGIFDIEVSLSKSALVGEGSADLKLAVRGQVGRKLPGGQSGEYTGAGTLSFRADSGGAALKCDGSFVGTGKWEAL
jgi:hypothetical protein